MALIHSGLAKKGYRFVNIDEGWLKGRDPATKDMIEDRDKFPSGMKALGKWVTSQPTFEGSTEHLRYGLYSSRGTCQCGTSKYGANGSHGFEAEDTAWMIDAGATWLKIDSCCGSQDHATAFSDYAKFRDAMNASGVHVWFNLCGWHEWYAPPDPNLGYAGGASLGNSWRIYGDGHTFAAITGALNTMSRLANYTKPGGYSDPDNILGPHGTTGRVTEGQARLQFVMWSIYPSQLILGEDVTAMSTEYVETVGNEELIAINQDAPFVGAARRVVGGDLSYPCYTPPPPVPFQPSGATLPTKSPSNFGLSGGASLTHSHSDRATSGRSIRTGNPGGRCRIALGSFIGTGGHKVDSVSLRFRYEAGYTPALGQHADAALVRVLLVEASTGEEVKQIFQSAPLGNYSFDHFTGFSPPVLVSATGLDLPNEEALELVIEVTNRQRNLQIPIDDLADGLDVHIRWAVSAAAAPTPSSSVVMYAPSERLADRPRAATRARAGSGDCTNVWARPLSNGDVALALLNHGPNATVVRCDSACFAATGLDDGARVLAVRDLIAHEDKPALTRPFEFAATVAGDGSAAAFRFSRLS